MGMVPGELWRPGPPGSEQAHCCCEIRLLYLVEHLVRYVLVVLRQTRPLAQERHDHQKEAPPIFHKALSFRGAGTLFHHMSALLHVLESMLAQQTREFLCHPIIRLGKEVSRPIKGLDR